MCRLVCRTWHDIIRMATHGMGSRATPCTVMRHIGIHGYSTILWYVHAWNIIRRRSLQWCVFDAILNQQNGILNMVTTLDISCDRMALYAPYLHQRANPIATRWINNRREMQRYAKHPDSAFRAAVDIRSGHTMKLLYEYTSVDTVISIIEKAFADKRADVLRLMVNCGATYVCATHGDTARSPRLSYNIMWMRHDCRRCNLEMHMRRLRLEPN